MYIELTPEQRQLQAELRQYFSNLISSDEYKEMEADRHGKAYRAVIKRMGSDGKLGVGWPKEFGGHGLRPDRAVDLRQRGAPRRRASARRHTADRRPDVAGIRQRTAEEEVPARDPGRRGALRDRLYRAGSGHRPRVVADHARSSTATSTSSTVRRCSPPVGTTPTSSGWHAVRIRKPPSTRAFRC